MLRFRVQMPVAATLPLLLSLCHCNGVEPSAAAAQVNVSQPAPTATETAPATPTVAPEYRINDEQRPLLTAWFDAVGERRDAESFGSLIVRAGKLQLGKAYGQRPQRADVEHLRIVLDTFQCVSFVESTLAIARCTWEKSRDEACFLREVREARYRDGRIDGYAARLHYFTDWLQDNEHRGRSEPLTELLGGSEVQQEFHYMSKHPQKYPAMNTDNERSQIAVVEARLSKRQTMVIGRDQVTAAQDELRDGDLVAFVGDKPGILVTHAGFIHRTADGEPRVLHASSYHKKVLLGSSVANYVLRKPNRRGVMVTRPLPPQSQLTVAQ